MRHPAKIDRLARIPTYGARVICCVDDVTNIADLSEAAVRHGTKIECLVEIDCGAGNSKYGKLDVAIIGRRAEIRLPGPLVGKRARVNCTMPGPDGRWRWFGRPFLTE